INMSSYNATVFAFGLKNVNRGGQAMTRREWLAAIAATPLVKAAPGPDAPVAPVAIVQAQSYDEDLTARLGEMFDQLCGIDKLVRNKTVAIKLNLTGLATNRATGRPPQFSHWAHPALAGAAAYLIGRAGAKRIRFVESAANTNEPLEEYVAKAEWDVHA